MYIFFSVFIIICLVFFFLNHHRKKRIIKKVCSLSCEEKCQQLNVLIEPLGYCYDPCTDIFSCHHNAWQREFGYTALFDRTAAHFNMVFDCQPIYFDYRGRTWLIEFWKGQYGINAGAEIGVYCADCIIPPSKRRTTVFHSVTDKEMLPFSLCLFHKGRRLFHLKCRHWWLAGFCMGMFVKPRDLCLELTVTFPNPEMRYAFVNAMEEAGCRKQICCESRNSVKFVFSGGSRKKGCFQRFKNWFAQWKNKWFCRIYLLVTRPFCLSMDKLLYLYFYLPFAFRRTTNIRRCKKGRWKKK